MTKDKIFSRAKSFDDAAWRCYQQSVQTPEDPLVSGAWYTEYLILQVRCEFACMYLSKGK